MQPITACVISFNEERKIEQCLASLQGVVDEIILVDSFSTDRTLELARPYVDKIVSQEFLGYIEQKNFAIEQASHDWILNLDCDERLTPALARSISACKSDLGEHAAYELARKTFYVYRWLDHIWYPEYRTRLFDRRRARHAGTNPHEKVELDSGSLGRLSGDLLHYSFDNITDHIKTLDRFTEIGAREIIKSGRPVSLLTPFSHGSWIFFKLYILRLGFMDGFAGVTVSVLSFMHVFVKYAKVLTYRFQLKGDLDSTALGD